LDSLKFSTMTDRMDGIPEAHIRTCHWIFEEPNTEPRAWSSFVKWLQNGSGVYWVNGKAASGKFTLLRYIHYHERTSDLVRVWAAP